MKLGLERSLCGKMLIRIPQFMDESKTLPHTLARGNDRCSLSERQN
jgi:hypothetical protein